MVALGRWWDWARIPQVVINRDGAKWIDEGVHLFSQAIRQLDGFHLARSCYQVAGEKGDILYEALRKKGKKKPARFRYASLLDLKVFDQLQPGERAWSWVKRVIEEKRGAGWRIQWG